MTSASLASAHFEAFVRHATAFLKIGFDDARPRISATTDEVVVTQYIVEAMNARSEAGNLPHFLDRFEATDDVKVSHPEREGKRRRIIDIRIVRAGAGRPVLEVEAKCLRKESNTIGDYTGGEGLLLFVNEEYARNAPVAAMLGYVQTDGPEYWIKELVRKLTAEQIALKVVGSVDALPDSVFDHAYKTRHTRDSGALITIHHFLVPCC